LPLTRPLTAPEVLELDEDELLLDELEELLLDELLLEDDELAPEELLDEELELLLEELEELLELGVSPVQVGATKLPSWLPWTPKAPLTVPPGGGNCQVQLAQLVNWKLVPGLVPVRVPMFHWLVTVTVSGKFSVTVQPVIAVVPVLVIDTSTWNGVPVLVVVTAQVYAANA
jgi:hypothetical protein